MANRSRLIDEFAATKRKIACLRHCEERSDEAIHTFFAVLWIVSLRSQ
jgi:hypothetical protein